MVKFSNYDIDIEKIVELEEATWPEGTRATPETFLYRASMFPEGFVSLREETSEEEQKVVGLSTSMIIQWSPETELSSWEDTTANGTISNHNEKGNALYVVSVGVHPHYRNRGYGSRLLDMQKVVAKTKGLDYIVLGSRMPFYHLSDESVSPQAHANTDREISFYRKNGFQIHSIVKNYMEDDFESRNYGVVMFQKV